MIIIETLSLSDALKYPFKMPTRLLYALLLFIPIMGPLTIYGYVVRLVNEFVDGKYEGPIKLDIIEDLKLGIFTCNYSAYIKQHREPSLSIFVRQISMN